MDKLFIASDIHGSAKYCKMMLEAFERSGAERLLLLGDLLYHGARNDLPGGYDVRQVFAMLNEYKDRIIAVRGNCDSEVDQMVLEFPIMAEYAVIEACGATIFAHHGHHFDPYNPMPLGMGEILLCGHTHVPKIEERENFVYLNPGSVSIPKGGSCRSYMLLEDGIFSWYDLETGKKYMEYSCKRPEKEA